METDNNVKPEKENLETLDNTSSIIDLDYEILSKELYALEKQKKQQDLIERANQQKETQVVSQPIQTTPEIKSLISFNIEDSLFFLNEFLEDRKLTPLNEIEITQISTLIQNLKGYFLSLFNKEDPQPKSFMKTATVLYKSYKIIKNIIYPRIEPYLEPFLERFFPFLKGFININKGDNHSE